MGGIPDLMFVIDTNKEAIAIQEARKLNIPVIAVLDTNSDPQGITFPVPGNDDAARALQLYCDLMADSVLDGLTEGQAAMGVDIGAAVEPVEPALAKEPEAASEISEPASAKELEAAAEPIKPKGAKASKRAEASGPEMAKETKADVVSPTEPDSSSAAEQTPVKPKTKAKAAAKTVAKSQVAEGAGEPVENSVPETVELSEADAEA